MISPDSRAKRLTRPVFLTGGTGLVGSHLAERLREQGIGVRALHRTTSRVDFLRGLGCELVEGDLEQGHEALTRAMVGCGAVVHAGATIYADLPWKRVRALNVLASAEVFRAAAMAGIRRGVHLSSVAVYGDPPSRSRGEARMDEAFPTDRPLRSGERYARSKREAETAVREVARGTGMEVTLLRASAVYGERDRLFVPQLVRALRRPVQPLLGSGRTSLPAVYAGNLATAIELALTRPFPADPDEARVRVYNVASDFPVTQRSLYEGLAPGLGTLPRFLPIPGTGIRAVARLLEGLGLGLPGAGELPPTRVALLATRPNPFRSDRIREELGWTPPVESEEALRRTAEWLRRGGGLG